MEQDWTLAYWWHLETPPGVLTSKGSGPVALTLLEALPWNLHGYPDALYGESAKGIYTLLNPRKVSSLSSRRGREVWLANHVVPEVHLQGPHFGAKTIAFRMEGLQDWTEFAGVERGFSMHPDSRDVSVSISYTRPAAELAHLEDIEVAFWTVWSMPGLVSGVNIEIDPSIVLTAPGLMPVHAWMDGYVLPLQRLFQMLTRRKGHLWSIQILPESMDELPYNINGYAVSPADQVNAFQDWKRRPKTPLSAFRDNLGDMLAAWKSFYRDNQRSIDAYVDEHFTPEGYSATDRSFFSAARLIEQLRDQKGSSSTTRYSEEAMAQLIGIAIAAPDDEPEHLARSLEMLPRRTSKSSMTI